MAPTIVYGPDGKLKMVVGSPGGSRIIGYVAKTIVAVLDWQFDIQDAIDLPHVVGRFGTVDVETGKNADDYVRTLNAMGHKTNIRDLNSGLHGVVRIHGAWVGGADPRREGIVLGD
jgi:gamma-glutamyltranspeptidase/glutathione hydrolase